MGLVVHHVARIVADAGVIHEVVGVAEKIEAEVIFAGVVVGRVGNPGSALLDGLL